MDRVKRIWYLSPIRAAKVQASLRIRAVSPEPSLLAHTSSESRGTFRQKARSLAPLNGWACAVKICHDGMLEDTNSLDGAHMMNSDYEDLKLINKQWFITNSSQLELTYFHSSRQKQLSIPFFQIFLLFYGCINNTAKLSQIFWLRNSQVLIILVLLEHKRDITLSYIKETKTGVAKETDFCQARRHQNFPLTMYNYSFVNIALWYSSIKVLFVLFYAIATVFQSFNGGQLT